jgi:GPH family glycoside/pentoside/hexuronide:cation symporter
MRRALRIPVAYSLGSLGTNIFAQAFSTFVLFFYIDHLHAPLGPVTAAMAVQSVWHAVLNPVVGWLSDRTRTAFGRRLPYIAMATLPLGLVFWFLWRPFVPRANLPVYFLVVVALFDLLYLVTVINWTSLYPEIFRSLEERARVSSWRQGFGIAALMIGVAVPPLLYGRFGWSTMGLALSIIGTAGFVALIFGIHPAARRTTMPPRPMQLAPALRHTLTQPGFLRYLGTNFLVQFVLVVIPAGMPFFAKYVLHVTHTRLTIMLAVTFVLAILLVRPWAGVILRFGSRRAFRAAIAILALGALPFFFIRSFLEGIAATALIGVGLSGFLMLVDIIMAEIIDDDERRVGERREGVYYGINGFVLRFGTTLESLVLYVILTVTHYHANAAGLASVSVREGFRVLMAGVPLVALMGALALFHGYRVAESQRDGEGPARAATDGAD